VHDVFEIAAKKYDKRDKKSSVLNQQEFDATGGAIVHVAWRCCTLSLDIQIFN
jgi:hypothetical protein